MSRVKVSLPDQTASEITRLVEQGEFLNEDQAIEELLTLGVQAYGTEEETEPDLGENEFGTVTDEQTDPALQDEDLGEDYTF
ncbi:MAG: CopG family transcriptional regulator [Haloarculaceae archaeon]